ncbi:alpha-tocopherol transfer protein-like isoform X2 [Zophobas morio]|uniref:alpha-tocopherol transfer protein-like isoform X2 n=1 Tax=Zophobas morio TaxID=2755281 RepID=UPI0030830C78
MENVKAAAYFVPFPKLTKQLYRVGLYKICDPLIAESVDPVDGIRLLVNIQEIRMIENITYGDVLKPKLITRIHFCENSDDLIEKFRKEILPEDYGGEEKSLKELQADKKIQNFLILNKGSVEKSKEKIENYYKVRSLLPEIFDNIHPKLSYMENLKAAGYFVPLPKLTKELYRVGVCKIIDPHIAEDVDPVDGIRLLVNIQEIRMIEDITHGDVFIFDGKNVPLRWVLKVTPMFVYKAMVVVYKQVFSNRMKAVYVVNAPSYIEKVIAVLKSVLSPKLLTRIHVCENSYVLIEKIGKEVLPVDYGGEEKSLKELQEMLYQKFQEREDYFTQLDKLRINEDLKPQELENDEMFGLSGNFKKLEID